MTALSKAERESRFRGRYLEIREGDTLLDTCDELERERDQDKADYVAHIKAHDEAVRALEARIAELERERDDDMAAMEGLTKIIADRDAALAEGARLREALDEAIKHICENSESEFPTGVGPNAGLARWSRVLASSPLSALAAKVIEAAKEWHGASIGATTDDWKRAEDDLAAAVDALTSTLESR